MHCWLCPGYVAYYDPGMLTERWSSPTRLRLLAGLLVLVAVAVTASGCSRKSSQATPQTAISSPAPSTPTTTLDPKAEVVARLREILRIRDEAISSRNTELLDSIHTRDCSCLRDGRAVIARLLKDKIVWKGLATSFEAEKIQRINERQWLLLGTLISSSVRIEKESGQLVRVAPAERNPFRFLLVKPPGEDSWLPGDAALLPKAG